MKFRMLGPLEVESGGRTVELGRPKQRAVLAALLLNANRTVTLDRLVDLLWGEDAPAQAAGALHVYISNLRRALEPERPARAASTVLLSKPPGYVLSVAPDECDAARFEALAASGRQLLRDGHPAAARIALDEALGLWRGPALADFSYEPFAELEASRLEELRQVALEERLEADLALGSHAAAVADLEVAVGKRPLSERLWGLLMVALYRSGRQGEALRAYAQARRVLGEELGIEPSPTLRRLEADILAQAPDLDWRPPVAGTSEAIDGASPPRRTTEPTAASGLVGREDELEALEAALERARTGHGSIVLLSGEAGVGKTRLADELARRAAAGGTTVAWGRCDQDTGAPPFWPWAELVRSLLVDVEPRVLREALGGEVADIAQLVPEVKELVDEVGPLPMVDAAEARFRLFGALSRFVIRLARQQPIVVVVDDLHWADVASLQLLEFLAPRVGDAGVLVAATYRDPETGPSHPLAACLGALARLPYLERLSLEGLSPADVGSLIAQTAGQVPAPAVVTGVHARTDGNPFFVAELAKLVSDDGDLADPEVLSREIPVGVRDVLRSRLAQLPPNTTDLLGAAAVGGREFDLHIAVAAAGTELAEAEPMIEAAVRVGVVTEAEQGVGRYRFAHALVRDVLYRELTGLRRARLHQRTAAALEALDRPPSTAHTAELAHHFYQAEPLAGPERALDYAVAAAEGAMRTLAYEEAEAQLRRALTLIGHLPEGEDRALRELEVQNRLGMVVTVIGGGHVGPGVSECWERARLLCRQVGRVGALLPSLWGSFAVAMTRADLSTASQLAGQLREAADASGDPALEMAGDAAQGIVTLYRGEVVPAHERLRRAAERAEAGDHGADPGAFVFQPVVFFQSYLGLAAAIMGDSGRARRLAGGALQCARLTGHPPDIGFGSLMDGWVAVLHDDATTARARGQEAGDVNRGRFADYFTLSEILVHWADVRDGVPISTSELEADVAHLGMASVRLECAIHWMMLADAFGRRNRPDRALTVIDSALAEVAVTGVQLYEAELHRLRGDMLAALGPDRVVEARAAFERAREVARAQGAQLFEHRAEAALSGM